MNSTKIEFIERKLIDAKGYENCGVYQFTSPRGYRYIGSSVDIKRRFNEHHREMAEFCHPSPKFNEEVKAIGNKGWKFEILATCRADVRLLVEKALIKQMQPELNDHWVKRDGKWARIKPNLEDYFIIDRPSDYLPDDENWLHGFYVILAQRMFLIEEVDNDCENFNDAYCKRIMKASGRKERLWSDFIDSTVIDFLAHKIDEASRDCPHPIMPRFTPLISAHVTGHRNINRRV